VRWHYRDPLLVWLLVASFGAHIVEEWIGGFPEWLAAIAGGPLPRTAFIAFNSAGMTIAALAARAAIRSEQNGWMAVAIASALACNGLLHLAGSVVTGSYSPGLLTSFILYAPLTTLVFMRAIVQASPAALRRGIIAGLVFHAVVMATAFTLARQAG
jgi:hypothetical protein